MYKKKIGRKWMVKKELLPTLSKYKVIKIKQGYLSQLQDSLLIRVKSENGEKFTLSIKDSGTKIRNEITYNITKEEFDISYALSGQKTISKRRFLIPSTFDSTRVLEVDFFNDIDLVMVEYKAEDETQVDTLKTEDWFGLEVTDDYNYTNIQLIHNKLHNIL